MAAGGCCSHLRPIIPSSLWFVRTRYPRTQSWNDIKNFQFTFPVIPRYFFY